MPQKRLSRSGGISSRQAPTTPLRYTIGLSAWSSANGVTDPRRAVSGIPSRSQTRETSRCRIYDQILVPDDFGCARSIAPRADISGPGSVGADTRVDQVGEPPVEGLATEARRISRLDEVGVRDDRIASVADDVDSRRAIRRLGEPVCLDEVGLGPFAYGVQEIRPEQASESRRQLPRRHLRWALRKPGRATEPKVLLDDDAKRADAEAVSQREQEQVVPRPRI